MDQRKSYNFPVSAEMSYGLQSYLKPGCDGLAGPHTCGLAHGLRMMGRKGCPAGFALIAPLAACWSRKWDTLIACGHNFALQPGGRPPSMGRPLAHQHRSLRLGMGQGRHLDARTELAQRLGLAQAPDEAQVGTPGLFSASESAHSLASVCADRVQCPQLTGDNRALWGLWLKWILQGAAAGPAGSSGRSCSWDSPLRSRSSRGNCRH